jgi:hypothetical protein
MKSKFGILVILSLVLASFSLTAYSQTKEEQEEKKKEMLQQEQILRKEQMEKQKALEEREMVRIRNEELQRAVRDAREAYSSGWTVTEPLVIGSDGDLKGIYFMGGSQNSSSLQFSKKVKEASFTKDLTFEIEEDARRASISVSGMCEEGEIRIWIAMPDNKPYTEVLIDEYGSVNWSKSFDIEEENGSKTGEWGFRITAKNATGNFRLSIQSN